MIFAFRKPRFDHRIVGRLEGVSQELLIELPVLKHVTRYRQLTAWSSEAGGQLFGTIDKDKVCVVEATGPYTGDGSVRISVCEAGRDFSTVLPAEGPSRP